MTKTALLNVVKLKDKKKFNIESQSGTAQIPYTLDYKYLGIVLDKELNLKKEFEAIKKKTNIAIASFWGMRNLSPAHARYLIHSMVAPVAQYRHRIVVFSKSQNEELEKLYSQAIHNMTKFRSNIANGFIYGSRSHPAHPIALQTPVQKQYVDNLTGMVEKSANQQKGVANLVFRNLISVDEKHTGHRFASIQETPDDLKNEEPEMVQLQGLTRAMEATNTKVIQSYTVQDDENRDFVTMQDTGYFPTTVLSDSSLVIPPGLLQGTMHSDIFPEIYEAEDVTSGLVLVLMGVETCLIAKCAVQTSLQHIIDSLIASQLHFVWAIPIRKPPERLSRFG